MPSELAIDVLSSVLVPLQYRRVHMLTEAARRMWQPPSFQQRSDGPLMSKCAPRVFAQGGCTALAWKLLALIKS